MARAVSPSRWCAAITHNDCRSRGLSSYCLCVILTLDTGRQGKAVAETQRREEPVEALEQTAFQNAEITGGSTAAHLTLKIQPKTQCKGLVQK